MGRTARPSGTLPEDPLPGDALDDRAADERPERDAEAADAAPGAQRQAAALARNGLREQRQGERGDDRAADALQGAGGDQRADRRRQGRRRRAGGEDRHSDQEHALAPVPVTERRAHEQEHGEGERVGVHGPLQAGDGRVQVALDRRKGHGHDEVVERRHEEREARDRERPERSVPVSCHSPFLS